MTTRILCRGLLVIASVILAAACGRGCSFVGGDDRQGAAPATAIAAASLVLVNGRVWTGDTRRPEAEAVAIADDRIIAVGSTAELKTQAPKRP